MTGWGGHLPNQSLVFEDGEIISRGGRGSKSAILDQSVCSVIITMVAP